MGSELVGTTAAETQDPEKTPPKAINRTGNVAIYVGALSLS